MTTGLLTSAANTARPVWRDPAAWAKAADFVAILLALSLPWSTSLVGIFGVVWVITLVPTLDLKAFLVSLRRPVSFLPIALFALAALGMLWSDAPWGARTYALSPTAKLLLLPLLFYHFERSSRGLQVFIAFLISCTLLLLLSWIVAFFPGLALKPDAQYGVPVKNYIDQSQEFALCAVVLAYPVITLLRSGRTWAALVFTAIAVLLVVNMVFIAVSRTALVTMPIMLAVFAALHLKWRINLAILLGGIERRRPRRLSPRRLPEAAMEGRELLPGLPSLHVAR